VPGGLLWPGIDDWNGMNAVAGRRMGRRVVLLVAVLSIPLLAGCATAALSILGAGASVGMVRSLDAVSHRTFSASAPRVRTAMLRVLKQMGIQVQGTTRVDSTHFITAAARDRRIEIELFPISAYATRVRVVAREGTLSYDGATAAEIVVQTERLLRKV
jgi:hypothetical protein